MSEHIAATVTDIRVEYYVSQAHAELLEALAALNRLDIPEAHIHATVAHELLLRADTLSSLPVFPMPPSVMGYPRPGGERDEPDD